MKRNAAFRRGNNGFSSMLVVIIVCLLIVTVSVAKHNLKQKLNANQMTIASLDEQIAAQEAYTEELEILEKQTQTQAYIEEVAREKLGLVKEGEIVFKIE